MKTVRVVQKIESIKERNIRVEIDKAWETSKTRRVLIAGLTYIIVFVFLLAINAPNPHINALVPAVGFILSTLTIPYTKKWWKQHLYKK